MPKSHSWFFYLCAIEGAIAIAVLLSIPSEGGTLSAARLALIGFIAAICIGWIYLGKGGGKQVDKYTRRHMTRLPVYLYTCILVSLLLSLLLFLLRYLNPENLLSTYQRLSPLLWYLLVLSIQLFFYFLLLYKGFHPQTLSSNKSLYLAALTAFCLLLFAFIFISLTRLGLTPDPAYWSEPGVPILGWQFGLAIIGGLFVLGLTFFARGERSFDLILPFAVYLLAIAIWLSVPVSVLKNSFYMPISSPIFQPFPYSDAGYYDQLAHSLLIGHPYQHQIPSRPLYIFLLAMLHLLFGENYQSIIIGQTLILAIIPVVLYFLGKKLHSRIAGVIIALFFIFRELTTLLISSNTRVSNTKTLLVDLPTLLLLLLACLFVIRWLEQKDWKSALIAGGTFGLLLLLRTQSLLVLPFIFLAALLVFGWKTKSFYLLTSLFLLGVIVTITPWLIHNYLLTGELTFDATFQYASVASQYAYSGNLDIRNYDFEGISLGRIMIEFALKDPGFVFGFITNHFLAAQVNGLLALPLIKTYHGIFEPINLYWMDWNGSLEWYNVLLIIVYLAIIAVGLGAAWKRWRWIGLLPVGFNVGYVLATAVGRFSGWRYDLPADWVPYFYFGIGIAEILFQAALMFGRTDRLSGNGTVGAMYRDQGAQRPFPQLIFFAGLFALIGALPWMAEKIASPRYPDQSPEVLKDKIGIVSNAPARNEINTFLSQPDAFIQMGRALYPRFYRKDDGLSSTNPWPSYEIRDYPRLGFLLLNQDSTWVVFPTKKISDFPHAVDAIVLGCQRDDYVEARMIILPESNSTYTSAPLTETCSSFRP
jgi:4-amino-4-deoxy-L-arabinose transferase-like glycosyltransferase